MDSSCSEVETDADADMDAGYGFIIAYENKRRVF